MSFLLSSRRGPLNCALCVDVSHSCYCPFCSKPLERVSQVVGHLSRCKARNGRALPKKITKLKLSAYDKLRRANNDRKQQASELTIFDFATIFKPSNTVHHSEGPLQTAEDLGQVDSFQQRTHLRAQVAENFNFGAASVCPEDRRSIQFSSARLQGLAPGLIDNLADGTASSTFEFSAPQQAIAEGVTPFLPMLQHAPQQALAPALEDNFAEGTTSLPMLQHTPLAPGLLNNFAEGSTSFSPMMLPRVPQQTVGPVDSLTDAYSPHASLQHYYPAGSSTESMR